MTQEEFNELAETECRSLHGDDGFNSVTAWKDGYLFAINKVRNEYYGCDDDTFLCKLEKLIDDLDYLSTV